MNVGTTFDGNPSHGLLYKRLDQSRGSTGGHKAILLAWLEESLKKEKKVIWCSSTIL